MTTGIFESPVWTICRCYLAHALRATGRRGWFHVSARIAFEDAWFWYIPLSATLTSVGAVAKQEAAARIQGNPERAYAGLIEDCRRSTSKVVSAASNASRSPPDATP